MVLLVQLLSHQSLDGTIAGSEVCESASCEELRLLVALRLSEVRAPASGTVDPLERDDECLDILYPPLQSL